MGDSLDLVVVGAYHGKGKRTNVYGAFLLACYDPDSENLQTICKIGTGFSDEVLLAFYESLKPLEIETHRSDLEVGGAKPDVWFEPKVVWEVLTADLSLSPVYTAAHGLVSSPPRSGQCGIPERRHGLIDRSTRGVSRYGSRGSSRSGTIRMQMRRRRRNRSASSTKGRRLLEGAKRPRRAQAMTSGSALYRCAAQKRSAGDIDAHGMYRAVHAFMPM